jgi:hypothetical protein
MAIEIGDKKRLAFVVGFIVLLGAAGYVWYPRLFSKRPPARVQQTAPPLIIDEPQPKPALPPADAKKPKPPGPAAPRVAAKPPAGAPAREAARAAPPPAAKEEGAPRGPTAARRYGLEFPPFVTMTEAEAYERRLKEAGLPTLRTVTDVDGNIYTLVIGPFPTASRATEAMRELGVKPGAPVEAEGGFVVNDGPYILREVVRRATEIKGKGHGVKIVRAEGKAPIYIIRTAATLDPAQAAKLSSHYRSLGFPNSVVPSR